MASCTVPRDSGCRIEGVPIVKEMTILGPPTSSRQFKHPPTVMLYTIAVILIILWLLGIVSGYTIGSFIHILLVIAIVMILLNFITGRRTL
jgi:hypothetical protein